MTPEERDEIWNPSEDDLSDVDLENDPDLFGEAEVVLDLD